MSQLILNREVCAVIPPINWKSSNEFTHNKFGCQANLQISNFLLRNWQNKWFNLEEIQFKEVIGLREWLRQEKPDVIGDWWWLVSKHTKQELIKTEWTNTLVIAHIKSHLASQRK